MSYPEHLCKIIFEFGPAVQMLFIVFYFLALLVIFSGYGDV